MRNILLVAVREILTLLKRPSFYVAALVAPLIVGVIFFGSSLLNDEFSEDAATEPTLPRPAGFVDQAGVVEEIPDPLHPFLVPYADEATAGAAVRAGTIDSFFVIVPDYQETGRVVRVAAQATFAGGAGADTRLVRALLRANLAGDPMLAQRLDAPLDLQMRVVDAAGTATDAAPQTGPFGGISMALALLLAFAIVNGGGWLIQAVAEEKESRTIEIVLTSLRPIHLMAGKLLGLGVIALLQLGVWLLLTRVGMRVGAPSGQFGAATVPAGLWGWILVFFLLGFLLFGGVMMAIGAVGASLRESGQISGLMTLPIVAPLWFAASIAENPHSTLAVALSLFPVTAPVTMIMRLVEASVPLWQLLLSVGLLTLGVIGAVWLAARLFRSVTLLTGARPTPRALWRAIRVE
jgi:ABC-2 type transport system permease protein